MYTRPWSLNLPRGTPVFNIVAEGIRLKRHMVTYASQTDVYLDSVSVDVHNLNVPKKLCLWDQGEYHTEGCGLFNLLTIRQEKANSRFLRILKHPVGAHFSMGGGGLAAGTPTGIARNTTTVHVQPEILKINAEPMLLGRLLHLIAGAIKTKDLGAKVKERVWGNPLIDSSWWQSGNAIAAAQERSKKHKKNDDTFSKKMFR